MWVFINLQMETYKKVTKTHHTEKRYIFKIVQDIMFQIQYHSLKANLRVWSQISSSYNLISWEVSCQNCTVKKERFFHTPTLKVDSLRDIVLM